MTTIQQAADRYLCHTGLVTGLLAKMGHPTPGMPLPPSVLAEFDAVWGDKIREARLAPGLSHDVVSNAAPPSPPPSTVRDRFKPERQVMRVAHERVGAGRDAQGNRAKRLLTDPSLVHAIDLAGTWDGDPWDGDPWRGEVVPGAGHFFGGPMNSGPTAACGRSHMRAVLGDEFVPDEDDPARAGQCPRCAQVVADGRGFRSPPGSCDPFWTWRLRPATALPQLERRL